MGVVTDGLCSQVPFAVLVTLGLAVLAWSVGALRWDLRRERRDPGRALAILRRFRTAVVGLSIAGAAAGWCWDIDWLLGLALIIGAEELLESSVGILALRHDPKVLAGSRARTGGSTPTCN
jgi:hypothetical protein